MFLTRNGRPLDRVTIWKEMKALCKRVGVSEKKVFPHNLRHLFARTFYGIEKNLSKLADLLGHSSKGARNTLGRQKSVRQISCVIFC